ncbi:hypothetical protein AB1Y20_021930 [Prymnesium parvum]|uniref:Uncharacterized protein n=1 Tax=Prymnesium parvum TaxID=97485 RepID=A0AB34JFD6_PRYPA|mmetsp:Transcript_9872/g.20893  ORF Transcript_9872/g.20893 Transcript_9872/m.20893 type:complete len:225 (-) Transcript_9872:154-828(-)
MRLVVLHANVVLLVFSMRALLCAGLDEPRVHSDGPAAHSHTPDSTAPASRNVVAEQRLHAAQQASVSDDWEAVARLYLEAYLRSDGTWPLKYNCLSGFASVLRERHFPINQYYTRVLQQISEESSVPPLHRVQAHFTLGFLSHLAGKETSASTFYRKALTEIREQRENIRTESVTINSRTGFQAIAVQDIFNELEQHAQENLNLLQGISRGVTASSTSDATREL